jgi:hypothetical protein
LISCAAWLRDHGVKVGEHREFGRRDIVARHPERGTVLVEVEGKSSKQKEQGLYSALGQTVLQMTEFKPNESYAIAVPDSPAPPGWSFRNRRRLASSVTPAP